MEQHLFSTFAQVIQHNDISGPDERLLLDRDGSVSIYYAPFDHTNTAARIVLAGITPGKTQMVNALREAHRQLRMGIDPLKALRMAKQTASFSGAMRSNLINLLDCVGVSKWLGLKTCGHLFSDSADKLQTTSVLRYPVFINGENYNGTPNMLRHRLLRKYLLEHFAAEAAMLKSALFIPLGPVVTEALQFLASEGILDKERVLDGLPHPSGANAERIAYFLGTKAKERLSAKTDAGKLDSARSLLRARISALPA
jgi:hypothetical protein